MNCPKCKEYLDVYDVDGNYYGVCCEKCKLVWQSADFQDCVEKQINDLVCCLFENYHFEDFDWQEPYKL